MKIAVDMDNTLFDDFGQRVELSVAQLADLVEDVKDGVLDDLLATGR